MVKVKICGLSRPEDIDMVNLARPDYIGFVFADSRRKVDTATAAKLKRQLKPAIKAVGVFVNDKPEKIIRLCREEVIDLIQLHGDETEDYIRLLKAAVANPVIKAVRISKEADKRQNEYISCDYILFDTYKNNQYGGSGEAFDWSLMPEVNKPFFLAGGINQDNIAEAIKGTAPYCIDVSSGVETDGYKDFNKIENIIKAVRSVRL